MSPPAVSAGASATLYVINGSHACATAKLMLAHKQLSYRVVALPTGPHPMLVRALGFPGHKAPIRSVDGTTGGTLALLDRMGTVPALRFDGDRVQTNHRIARFLDRVRPNPPLFPADVQHREAVEQAESWGDEPFQMVARRLALSGALGGLQNFREKGNTGRLGALLARGERARVLAARTAAAVAFNADQHAEARLLRELPALFDRIEGWIAAGVLDGEQLNAADYVIAPSLALLAYRLDLREQIEARPLGAFVERVLPEPPLAAGR